MGVPTAMLVGAADIAPSFEGFFPGDVLGSQRYERMDAVEDGTDKTPSENKVLSMKALTR